MNANDDARAWYRRTFLADLPVSLRPDLEQRSETCWATSAAPQTSLVPFSKRRHNEFQALGHWGYGANSWCVYFIERTEAFGLFLRVLSGRRVHAQ